MVSDKFRLTMFVLYSLLFEALVWGIFGYAVFILHHSGWWMALAVFISSAQFRPKSFGLN